MPPTPAEHIKARKEQIDLIDRRLAPFAIAFSQSLGEGSRSIKLLLTAANLLTAISLIFLIVFHTRKMVKQRLAFENALKVEKERAEVTLASLGEAVISTDAEGRLNYMNPAAERLTGCATADAQGSPLSSLFGIIDEATETANDRLIDQSLDEGVAIDRQRLVRPDSTSVAVSIVGAPLHAEGKVAGAVLVFHDMTREREFVARLSWQASHDALTGLANRREFESRLEHALDRLSHQRGEHALMFLDLDQFKVVNDTCGHAAGDQLLRQTSGLLERKCRHRRASGPAGRRRVWRAAAKLRRQIRRADRRTAAIDGAGVELRLEWVRVQYQRQHRPRPYRGGGQRGGDAKSRGHGLLHGKGERP